MKTKPTFLLLLALAACAMVSCNSEDADAPETVKGAEVSFNVSKLTRASVITSIDNFAIYGDVKSCEGDAAPVTLFKGEDVKYRNGVWSYEGTRYWIDGFEHSFTAIAPAAVTTNTSYSNSRLSFTYTIPTDADGTLRRHDDVADLLTSTHRRIWGVSAEGSTVSFTFSHIMSLINIAPAFEDNILTDTDYLEFLDIELSGFKTKAQFSVTPASLLTSAQTDDCEISVAAHTGESRLVINFAEPIRVANDGRNVSLFDNNDAIIMLPQVFEADSEAKITLSYTISDSPEPRQVTFSLKGHAWDSGKSYTYRFKINRNGPIFQSAEITEWDQADLGNIDAH